MKLYPAGPLERAIALTNITPIKPAPGNPRKMIAIGCLSAIIGAAAMYLYMKKQTKNNDADTNGDKA
ncbi:MAG: hypothetical protein ABI675_14910 [Chitinophagaceae bacterium]